MTINFIPNSKLYRTFALKTIQKITKTLLIFNCCYFISNAYIDWSICSATKIKWIHFKLNCVLRHGQELKMEPSIEKFRLKHAITGKEADSNKRERERELATLRIFSILDLFMRAEWKFYSNLIGILLL